MNGEGSTGIGAACVVGLGDVDAGWMALVGGKAAALGALIKAGERVSDGFCIATVAHDVARAASGALPDDLRREVVQAYERLGAGAVAVRSSATGGSAARQLTSPALRR